MQSQEAVLGGFITGTSLVSREMNEDQGKDSTFITRLIINLYVSLSN
ncbi:hypothetical protein PIIN_10131 [Serendipita indica DSM 11827]|uniref:Uncharacterized protein n=1 Tax=Serendipita indica (strain DSM 11827) TaxID=1109443 RepID=G4TXT8_SERID|nr:hypothetical protein PIIN_10131 [Serendipita indica DSM 11827]